MDNTKIKIGFITVSDRAFSGEYEDLGGPAMRQWVDNAILSPKEFESIIIPDEQAELEYVITDMAKTCELILTTGGTGPTRRDITPEATQNVCERIYDGFAEAMRLESLKTVPTAILSRATAGTLGQSLIINLPGKPDAIAVCLSAVFLAVPKCLELIADKNIQIDLDFVES
jgi:molybdopterin adenylyltransferase